MRLPDSFHDAVISPAYYVLAEPLARAETRLLRLIGRQPETTFPYASSLLWLILMVAIRLAQDWVRQCNDDGSSGQRFDWPSDYLTVPIQGGWSLLLAFVVMLLRQWLVLSALTSARINYCLADESCPVIEKGRFSVLVKILPLLFTLLLLVMVV
ncbi:hypothetical protein PG995_014867 [Apiospora arundinis]